MTSQNNSLTSSRGSALIVTILLVSVLLSTALILLQRIIPYAKSVRSMHDASQAYYTARGEVDTARLQFLYAVNALTAESKWARSDGAWGRDGGATYSSPTSVVTKSVEYDTSGGFLKIALPFINLTTNARTTSPKSYTLSSGSPSLPLKIKLSEKDDVKNFGTSKTDASYHTLYSRNAGGLRFDLRWIDMSTTNFTLGLALKGALPGTALLTVKMQYLKDASDSLKTFTAEYNNWDFTLSWWAISNLNLAMSSGSPSSVTGSIQEIAGDGSITSPAPAPFDTFISAPPGINCTNASLCNLTLILNNPTAISVDFQLTSSAKIPDLNAVVIGDGLSGNGLYYQRIIDLIPTKQDI